MDQIKKSSLKKKWKMIISISNKTINSYYKWGIIFDMEAYNEVIHFNYSI
jgi:hypothetical protein